MSDIKNAEQNTHFDLNDFNREFVFKKQEAEMNDTIKSREKLELLDEKANKKTVPIYNLSVLIRECLLIQKHTNFQLCC